MHTHSTLPAESDAGPDDALPLSPALLRELRQALRAIRYGADRAGDPRRAGSAAGATRESPLRYGAYVTPTLIRPPRGEPLGATPCPGTDRTAGSPPIASQGDRRMRAVRFWVSGIILAAGSVAVAPQAMAQQEATTPDSASLQPGWTSWTSRSACSSACGSSPPTAPRPRPRTRSRRPPAARTASASSRRTGSSA